MNKVFISKLVFVSAILNTHLAFADIIKCTFSEPFISSEYSMTKSTLTYAGLNLDKKLVIKNVSFQIMSGNLFKLIDQKGNILQEITLDMSGSDGASDTVFPYSVKDLSPKFIEHKLQGGCSSNYLKAKVSEN